MKHIGQHAIVIGAGMGGLLAARALSDFHAVVTMPERDAQRRHDGSAGGSTSLGGCYSRRS
jgi:phytoene dehydrogenase-like protein